MLAYRPELRRTYLRIDADAFRRHNFPKDFRATIPREGGEKILTPFCTALEGAPNVPSDAPVWKIAAKVEINLEEAYEDDCAVISEWTNLAFVSITTLTVRGPISSEANTRRLRPSDKKGKPTSSIQLNRNLNVHELILVRLDGTAGQHITSQVRLEGLHSLVLEWCVEYAQILRPLAHQPNGLRRLEVYSPSAAWYKGNQSQDVQAAEDIRLCDFVRAGRFELQRLHIVGGAFGADRSLHNYLFFAIQTHLKSLRQLRLITSDHFDPEELREMGLHAPKLADLLIRAPVDDFLVSSRSLPPHTTNIPNSHSHSHSHNPSAQILTLPSQPSSQPSPPTSKPSSPSDPSPSTTPRPPQQIPVPTTVVVGAASSPPPPPPPLTRR